MTDSVQTVEACTIMDSVQPIEEASPRPQNLHNPTPPLPSPVVIEQFAQTDTPSPPLTKQASTQTGTLLRDYRVELKAKKPDLRKRWRNARPP